MVKVFIATPAYTGQVYAQYAISLTETFALLTSKGIETTIKIRTSGALLVIERNCLIKAFLDSDCTHMLCIDADLGWPPRAVLDMITYDVDFVGGTYPARAAPKFFFRPMYKKDKSLIVSDKHLIKMEYMPAGFLLLKRKVLEKMIEYFPKLYFKSKNDEMQEEGGYCLFATELWKGEFWGEDFVFCRRARQAGFDIWADPMIEFNHAGSRGRMAQCLTFDKKKSGQIHAFYHLPSTLPL